MAGKRKRSSTKQNGASHSSNDIDFKQSGSEKRPSKAVRVDGTSITGVAKLSSDTASKTTRNLRLVCIKDGPLASSPGDLTPIPAVRNLTFRVPPGFEGRIRLEIDFSTQTITDKSLVVEDLYEDKQTTGRLSSPPASIKQESPTPDLQWYSRSEDETKCGFLKLPTELRDLIYCEVFVSKRRLSLAPYNDGPINLSPAFLRTCRQVHREGSMWLYSANTFSIISDHRLVGDFWQHKWRVLGYETAGAFLKKIGGRNIKLLSGIRLYLQDFSMSDRPRSSQKARRFYNDPHLYKILKHLSQVVLENLEIVFQGRKKLQGTGEERRFFHKLFNLTSKRLKINGAYGSEPTKLSSRLLVKCHEMMDLSWEDGGTDAESSSCADGETEEY